MQMSGSTIMVTGASGGIGRAIALELAGAGAKVVAVARSEDALQEVADAADGAVRWVSTDLTDSDARRRLFEEVPPSELDAIVNNAGAAWVGSFLDMSEEDAFGAIELNLGSLVAVCKAVVGPMLERGSGHIVNIGSILGFAPGPPLTMYSATKAAVHAFTEGLRRELVGSDVRVTLVAPGPVKETGALDQPGDEETTRTLQRAFDTFGTTPEEVAKAVRVALERGAKPSTRTITVPRIAGLSRVASIPGADWAMDQGFGLLRRAGVKV
jgi:short-subunit dehydrogenase